MNKKSIAVTVVTVLIIAVTGIIWGHSLQPAPESMAVSNSFREWLESLFGGGGGAIMLERLRKLAHFVEFALLGTLWGILSRLQNTPARRRWMPLLGALTAPLDECIQIFVPGRAPAVTDVLLDWAGFATGIGIVLLAAKLWKWCRRFR